jgi:hypothetical protein
LVAPGLEFGLIQDHLSKVTLGSVKTSLSFWAGFFVSAFSARISLRSLRFFARGMSRKVAKIVKVGPEKAGKLLASGRWQLQNTRWGWRPPSCKLIPKDNRLTPTRRTAGFGSARK